MRISNTAAPMLWIMMGWVLIVGAWQPPLRRVEQWPNFNSRWLSPIWRGRRPLVAPPQAATASGGAPIGTSCSSEDITLLRSFRAAHSGARDAILLRRLQAVCPSIISIQITETFLIRAQDGKVLQEVVAFLQEECSSADSPTVKGAPQSSQNQGETQPQVEHQRHVLFHYGPKLQVPSVWSSNVRSILSARGLRSDLAALPVLERGRAYRLDLLADTTALASTTTALGPQVERLLHDAMTECRYPPSDTIINSARRGRVEQAWRRGGRRASCDGDGRSSTDSGSSKEAVMRAAERLGVKMNEWDGQFVADYFTQHVGRGPTEVELFDVAQSLSEHCRHWTFYGRFVVDGEEQSQSLLALVKEPLERKGGREGHGDNSILAFCDNSSAIRGWKGVCILQPSDPTGPSELVRAECNIHPTLTAETHNFPCSVAPFPGAQTGVGGRIRDIQAVGRGGATLGGLAGYAVGSISTSDEKEGAPSPGWRRPSHVAGALDILIGASDGASDYANKFGEPLIAGFARAYPQARRGDGDAGDGAVEYEFVKPIMFSAGVGTVRDEHLDKHHTTHEDDEAMCVVKVGGPPFRVGLGGGGASSRVGGDAEDEEHETNAVQRGDPEVGNKVGRLLRACVELGAGNPLASVHDQGAGGNANVLKELVAPAGGAHIDLKSVARGRLDGLTPLELWAAEYQESYGLLVRPKDLPLLQRIGHREAVGVDVVGSVTGSGRITVTASIDDDEEEEGRGARSYVDLPLEPLLGDLPQRVFNVTTSSTSSSKARRRVAKRAPLAKSEESVMRALESVLGHVSVGSKGFLVHKVDRSVTGLVAQQPCVGPLGLPVADVGVCAVSYWGVEGVATALGECPNLATRGGQAMARMAVGEALTNLVWAPLTAWEDIKLQANWMWPPPADMPGQGAALYRAVEALSEVVSALGLAVDGGKDSLSMAVSCPSTTNSTAAVTVPSPPTVVITAYATTTNVSGVVSPDVKAPALGRQGVLLYLPLTSRGGRRRLGGSVLEQAVVGVIGGREEEDKEGPDMEEPELFRARLKAVQSLVKSGVVLAGHDVSSGGLITTVLEMVMAGDGGATLDLTEVDPSDGWRALFSEELGVVMEVEEGTGAEEQVQALLDREASGTTAIRIGTSTPDRRLMVSHGGSVVLEGVDMSHLRCLWEKTSLALEAQQTNPACVQEEARYVARQRRPQWRVPFDPLGMPHAAPKTQGQVPKVAILREQGSNGDREMAAAFMQAGFQAWDVTVGDLVSGQASLEGFQGLALVGGFSYGDVLGSARGWAKVLRGNERARRELENFFARPDTFSLGVCNGCQLLVELGVVGCKQQQRVRLEENESGRFESRFVTVRVGPSPSVLLKGMEGAVLGVWSAHGEGRFRFATSTAPRHDGDVKDESAKPPLVYVDASCIDADEEEEYGGRRAAGYPCNPSGSEGDVAGLCSADGRHLALMPHPERSWIRWQLPWQPSDVSGRFGEHSPWLRMFQNAYHFCINNHQQPEQQLPPGDNIEEVRRASSPSSSSPTPIFSQTIAAA